MENCGIKKETHIRENGKIFRLKDGGSTILRKEHFLEESGKKINRMDLEWRNGQGGVPFLVFIKKEIKVELEY
jgi:hypothetical protein